MSDFAYDYYDNNLIKVKKVILEHVGQVAGRYKFEIYKSDANGDVGDKKEETPWIPNLITNAGLERLATGSTIVYCQVGVGNTAPSFTDSSLAIPLANTSTVRVSVSGVQSTAPYYCWYRVTFRFAAGVAAGVLSEVAVGWNSTNGILSRTLIADVNGDPTTITVLSDEYLDVTFEFRLYVPTVDGSSSITMAGVNYSVLSRAARVTDTQAWSAYYLVTYGVRDAFNLNGLTNNNHVAYNGAISASLTGSPSGATGVCSLLSTESYVANSLTRDFTGYWGLDNGNVANGISSFILYTSMGCYQISYTPAIPKDATYVLSLTHRISWARYAP